MSGLLDGISDPETMAWAEERLALAEHLARALGCSFDDAMSGLAISEQRAMEQYHVGNSIPWRSRH